MGNQSKKEESCQNYFHDQIELLKWRADPEHNTHIARTFIINNANNRTQNFEKVVASQLSNKKNVNLTDLRQKYPKNDKSSQLEQVLKFQEYFTSLAILEDSLTMEENIYVLTALLFGYEKIYKKLGKACVHASCCFLTEKGEVRAWINRDPIRSNIDEDLVRLVEKKGKFSGKGQRVLCVTEGSICRSILKLGRQLSDKKRDFMGFYQECCIFMNINMLQNMNFIAIRTFINGFVFRNRLHLSNNILPVIQRLHFNEFQLSNQYQRRSAASKPSSRHTLEASKSSLSLKKCGMDTPFQSFIQNNAFSNQQQNRLYFGFSDSHPQSHLEFSESRASSKQPPYLVTKQVQTSQIQDYEWNPNFASIQAFTPKSNNISTNHQLIISDNLINEAQNITHIIDKREKENCISNFGKKAEEHDFTNNKSVIIDNYPKYNATKLVRFHSHHPSFIKQSETNSINAQPTPQKSDVRANPSLFFTKRNCSPNYSHEQSENSSSNFSNLSSNMKNGIQSRALTRMVSCLVSNNELDVCQSAGSFQSIQNSQDSTYSGVLLGMGRSVEIPNEPSRNRSVTNPIFGTSPHMTF